MSSTKLTMIIHAGLGNQLFMIFTGLSKAIDENREFSVYPIFNNGFRHYYFSTIFRKLLFKVEDKHANIYERPAFEEKEHHYVPIPNDVCVLKGYFQSYKYFDHNKYRLIKYLDFDYYYNKYKINDDSIGIHFRFGDYTFNQIDHHQLRPSYYINAISRLFELIPNVCDNYKFIIFSEKGDDDLVNDYIEIINNKLKEKFNKVINFIKIYDIYKENEDYQELFYMASCKHLIIANSSFSWFSAYLCTNQEKAIIYPDEWFGPRIKNQKSLKDMFPNNWVKVKAL